MKAHIISRGPFHAGVLRRLLPALPLLALGLSTSFGGPIRLPGLLYHPEGDAIVIEKGVRSNNRPLYCHERFTVVQTGELPTCSSPFLHMSGAVARGGTRIPLTDFAGCVARYRPGRMEWELSDPRLPGFRALLVLTTLADARGYAARFSVLEGGRPGDQLGWFLVPPDHGKGTDYRVSRQSNGFLLQKEPMRPLSQVQIRFSGPVRALELAEFSGAPSLQGAAVLSTDVFKAGGLVAWLDLDPERPSFVAVAADENDPKFYAALVRREEPLDPSAVADAEDAFSTGLARVEGLGCRVEVDTPDPYFNAGVKASVAASIGLFVNPCFVHGGSAWRNQQPGWRTMGAAYNYGFHEEVKRSIRFWGGLQVKTDKGSRHGVYSPNGCQQAGDSRFFGAGFIDYKQPPHYEFQTQFFDEAVRAWRATGDPELGKLLLPMLELHLTRSLECFDPDGDGLYESYNNTWPNDSIWFSGGGTVEQSAYVYYGRRAAADMRRLLGDTKGAAQHTAVADAIRSALDRILWLPAKGHYASYVEQGGHRRVHDDAWVYSEHLPIEAGMSTPLQAWQAMYYTEWAMERFPFPFGGEMRQTSNYVPGQWSIRETYAGDNFAMALGYGLAGQGDEAWKLLGGTMLHSMYGDPLPMRGYGNEMGVYGRPNHVSPGGLSHPNCGIDFNDITSSFGRAVVEGVFGYLPDYPNGRVAFRPAFPSSWDHASLATPDFSISYVQSGLQDRYKVSVKRRAELSFRLPVRSTQVKSVLVDGRPVPFSLEAWLGCGMLTLTTPAAESALVAIELADRLPKVEPIVAEGTPGARLQLEAPFRIKAVLDPQGCVGNIKVSGSQVDATVVGQAGYHLLFLEAAGDVPWLLPVKLHLTDPAGDAAKAARSPRTAPPEAQWNCVDLSPHLNADLRSIFKQRYLSPRPDTVSMRLGYDGWTAWTFTHWRIPVPEIKFDRLGELTGADGRLHTPQNARFMRPDPARNIAFTSLWDNWPRSVTVPVQLGGEAVWLLLAGSTTPMQLKIANAVVRFKYEDGVEETLELVPPVNFWSLCRFGRLDYEYVRDGFVLPKEPPMQVMLGENCRSIVCSWKLRANVKLASVTLETLSGDVVIGLMAVSVMNPSGK